MNYGYFDDKNREYVITDPRTPVKWINYIGTLQFGGFVDQTGGALLCKGDPAQNRITRYLTQDPSSCFKGETLYLRIKTGKGYTVFSPFYVPTLDPFDRYECHVGLGFNRYITEMHGLRAEILVFVPRDDAREIRDIRITNISDAPLEVDVIPVVEYTHPSANMQLTNADWVPQTMTSRIVTEQEGRKTLIQYAFMNRDTKINFFTSNHAVSSFESDRKRFLGLNEYGTWAHPAALENSELGNYEANRGDNIGALLHHLGVITPGTTKRLITQLGQDATMDKARPGIEKYRDPAQVDAAFAALASFWDDYLSKLTVNTPDDGMNRMLNIHNPRQCYITKQWSRYLSYYQLGYGARGIGFRDSAQDAMGVLVGAPQEGRDLIRMLLHIQRRSGCAYHQMNPLTLRAEIGEAGKGIDYYGDDHLWIVLAVCEYLKETGDYAFLDERIPFYDKDPQGQPVETVTILDHLHRAIAFTTADVGKHGLPLLGFADWNDTVNLPAGAESLFNAHLYGVALLEMMALAEYRGDQDTLERCRRYYDNMKEKVNTHAWDGEWYVRYFDHNGAPLGSAKNTACKIYINGQSWPVLAGFATRERALKALESLNRLLNTKYGIKIATPGYKGFVPGVGGIATYPPGAKENSGIFLHPNPWVMMAETMVGNGNRAFEYYAQINPAVKNDDIDRYEVEPYVYAQNILSDEHPQFGLGRNSWLSGTSSWVYQAATKYMLGVRPEHAGLRLDPCIPAAWSGFNLTRRFRGSDYRIKVTNPNHVSKGVVKMEIDGRVINGNLAPLFTDGKTHEINIIMG